MYTPAGNGPPGPPYQPPPNDFNGGQPPAYASYPANLPYPSMPAQPQYYQTHQPPSYPLHADGFMPAAQNAYHSMPQVPTVPVQQYPQVPGHLGSASIPSIPLQQQQYQGSTALHLPSQPAAPYVTAAPYALPHAAPTRAAAAQQPHALQQAPYTTPVDGSTTQRTASPQQAPVDAPSDQDECLGLLQSLGFTVSAEQLKSRRNGFAKMSADEKAALPELMLAIQLDPRYRRLIFMYKPSKTTADGLLQYAKTKIDPSHIPGFKVLTNTSRVFKYKNLNKDFSTSLADCTTGQDLSEDVLENLQGGVQSMFAKQSMKTATNIIFSWIPLVSLIPGDGLSVLAYKGAEKGVAAKHKADGLEGEALRDYKMTKAFLLYLGAPATKDDLYCKWEKYRIQLKELFGAKPEDDIFLQISVMKDYQYNTTDTRLTSVPMLVMLWHVYSCWDTPYYRRFVKLKDALLGRDPDAAQAARDYENDKKSLGYDPTFVHDNHVSQVHVERSEEVVQVLMNELLHSGRLNFLSQNEDPNGAHPSLEWWVRELVGYFFKKQQVWAYTEDDPDKTIRAVALLQPPSFPDFCIDKPRLTKIRGFKSIGRVAYGLVEAVQQQGAALMRKDLAQLKNHSYAAVHFFGVWHEDLSITEDSTPFSYVPLSVQANAFEPYAGVLLSNIAHMQREGVVTYALAHPDQCGVFEEVGFSVSSPEGAAVAKHSAGCQHHIDPATLPDLRGLMYVQ